MKRLTSEEILAIDDLKREDVKIPEWDCFVTVQELTATARDEYEGSIVQVQGDTTSIDRSNLRAKLVALSCVDENGERLFSKKQVKALGAKSASAIDRIVDVARKLSAIGDDGLEEVGNDSKETLSVAS